MKVFDLSTISHEQGGVVAFGFFDCMHLGHKKVISEAMRIARELGVPSSVFLFENNIFPLLGIAKHPVYTFEERVAALEKLGPDNLFALRADRPFLSKTPKEFIEYMKQKLSFSAVVCGKDFSYGKNGAGSAEDLSIGLGVPGLVVDLLERNGKKISTESVKNALADGDIPLVEQLIGREFSIIRKVISGRKDGTKIGFPTINTELLSLKMKEGVYFTKVFFSGRSYAAVTNVGTHPTFGDDHLNAETHILDYSGDLYGKSITITFLHFHRVIKRFQTVEDLIQTINGDVVARRNYD